jgi:hypothetical protein
MREYLAHQGEVAAIERGLASMTALSGMVAAEDLPRFARKQSDTKRR